jgi:hypothetical protein
VLAREPLAIARSKKHEVNYCSVLPAAKAVLSSSTRRVAAPANKLASGGKRVVGFPAASATVGPTAKTGVAAIASPLGPSVDRESNRPAVCTPDREARGDYPSSPHLKELRSHLLSDPEPEKVLGLIDEVRQPVMRHLGLLHAWQQLQSCVQIGAKLAAKKAKQARDEKLLSLREELKAAEADKRSRATQEKRLELMWKAVVTDNASEMDRRVQEERKQAKEREHEQKYIRERQIAEINARRARDAAEKRAYELYQLKLSTREEELLKEEQAKALQEKRGIVKAQVRIYLAYA